VVDLEEPDATVREQVEVEAKYAGYIKRQEQEIARVRRHDSIQLPASLSYAGIPGLSNELRQKLEQVRPETLARAARIPGMTPAALSLLLVQAKKLSGARPVPGAAVRA